MTDSLSKTRAAVLARLVCRAPRKSLGRTQLMKLFFFLQELKGAPLGYDFRLFTYGPFDSQVLSDLATCTTLNTVNEKAVIYARAYGYEISPGDDAEKLSRELEECDRDLAAQVDGIIDEFGSFGAAELELRSTILFVDRELGSPVSASALADRIRQIKPHFGDRTILDRVQDMKDKGWLQNILD